MRLFCAVVIGLLVMMADSAFGQSAIHCTCFARNGSIDKCLLPNGSCGAYCEEMIGFSVIKTEESDEKCGSAACPVTVEACLLQQDDAKVTWPRFALDFDQEIDGAKTIDADAEDLEPKVTRTFCSPYFDAQAKSVVQSSVTWDWSEDDRQRHYCKTIVSCGAESFPARRMMVRKYTFLEEGSKGRVCLIVRNSWSTKKSSFHLRVWLKDK